MTSKVSPIPAGYHTITPYLIMKDAAGALEFYKKAFNAKEILRSPMPDGKIGHAEIMIGNSHLMLADECPEMNMRGAQTFGGSPVMIHLYVEDVDTIFNQAIKAGAKELRPLADQFYGDRSGCLVDPFQHMWSVSTHIEDVSFEEVMERCKQTEKYT